MKMPLLDLSLLRSLVALSQADTMAQAASRVGRTQSAISLQMQRLEDVVGASLFNRSGRALVLNETGQAMVNYAERMLALNAEAVAHVRGHDVAGSARLGVSVDFEHTWLPKAMARFSRTHPRIVVELRVDRNSALEKAIGARELDIALVFGADVPGEHAQRGRLPMAWIAAASFEWEPGTELPLLLLEHPCFFRTAAIQALDAAAISSRVAVTSPSLGGIWATAAAGLGVTVRSAAAIPSGLHDVGAVMQLPALPAVGIKILEAKGEANATRATLRTVLDGIVDELLADIRTA